ncbi:MAG TPA: hypothetical protein DCL44_07500 [Elusimicrobia bacterium]|nr:hypothetical protein [Elusimicrobiota bacterium]
MDIHVEEVKNKKQLKQFVLFQNALYKNNPYYVPSLYFDEVNTLDPEKNPACEFCDTRYFLAYKGKKIVGRIAGIINNRYIEIWKNKYARFGWVDFIEDPAVAEALFNAVEIWAKEQGMSGMQGPLGFTDFDKEGLLVEGFNVLGTLPTIYNHPYYPEYIESMGYIKEIDWVEYKIKIPNELQPDILRIANIAERRLKLKVVHLKKAKDVLPYAKKIFELLNDGYRQLFGFVPLTDAQVQAYTKQYFSFVNPDFLQVVVDSKNELAAIAITMPSLSKALQKSKGRLFPFGFMRLLRAIKHNDAVDLYLITVRKDLQGKGVNAILMREVQDACLKYGVKYVYTAPELETNINVRGQWKYYENEQDKRRRCYIKLFNKA